MAWANFSDLYKLLAPRILTCGKNGTLYDGVMIIGGGRILWIGNQSEAPKIYCPEYKVPGNMTVIPGMINAHAHLHHHHVYREADNLKGMDLLNFLSGVKRKSSEKDMFGAIKSGIHECLSSGITTCVNNFPLFIPPIFDRGVRFGIRMVDLTVVKNYTDLRSVIRRVFPDGIHGSPPLKWRGIFLHTPIGVDSRTVEWICELRRRSNIPVGMHFLEFPEEMDYFAKWGAGSIAEEGRGHSISNPSTSINNLLRLNILAIHCNYLRKKSSVWDAALQANIVICPRSTIRLQNPLPSIKSLIDVGSNIIVASDSRSVAGSINLFEELRLLERYQPLSMPFESKIKLVTKNAADALGLESEIGSLDLNSYADFVIITDPDDFLRKSPVVQYTFVGGRLRYSSSSGAI
ncbi:amidohydrolase family protein [Burkholderia plantarii]|uniref:amidohydrolase family protein n=1 Tax=Burkholderia plantarii TaxID=41899 RepID=UPI001495AFF4|nr:amidohydrolase family protein [Burkholderia plantarii]